MSTLHQAAEVTTAESSLAYDYLNQQRNVGAVLPETRARFILELKGFLECSLSEASAEVQTMERLYYREHLRELGLKFYS